MTVSGSGPAPNAVPRSYHGTCQCGCGEPTPLATRTHKARGLKKGQPTRYLPGHQTRYFEFPAEFEDRGYVTPCLIWKAAVNSKGYPIRGTKAGGLYLVHRRVVEQHEGSPLQRSEEVHHLCGVPRCVNVEHLEVLTQTDHREGHWRERKANGDLPNRCACGWYIAASETECSRCAQQHSDGGLS